MKYEKSSTLAISGSFGLKVSTSNGSDSMEVSVASKSPRVILVQGSAKNASSRVNRYLGSEKSKGPKVKGVTTAFISGATDGDTF